MKLQTVDNLTAEELDHMELIIQRAETYRQCTFGLDRLCVHSWIELADHLDVLVIVATPNSVGLVGLPVRQAN
jgi:hypothetical protein